MARSINTIQQSIIDSLVTNMQTIGVAIDPTTWSKRNIMRLWTFIVAAAIGYLEQLIDAFKSSVEATAAKAIPATPAWIQAQILKFQYDAVTPQVVQLVNLVPQYPIVDPTKQIVTRCSVKTDLSYIVKIKVAKQNPPIALASAEKDALQSYMNTIGIAGVAYAIISESADQIYIAANIYFKGQYSTVIQANVIGAINNFLSTFNNINFDGTIKMSDIEGVIRNVEGVNDVVLIQVRVRRDSDTFDTGSDLIANQQIISRFWNSFAGYLISETTTGKTLTDSLTFTAE
jgi:hypothetical protein